MVVGLDLLGILGDPNAATLTSGFRFDDVGFVFLLPGVRLEVAVAEDGVGGSRSDVKETRWRKTG